MLETSRRSFITGLISFTAAAPAIVRAASLMPVKALVLEKAPAPIFYESTASGFSIYFQVRFWRCDGKSNVFHYERCEDPNTWNVDA